MNWTPFFVAIIIAGSMGVGAFFFYKMLVEQAEAISKQLGVASELAAKVSLSALQHLSKIAERPIPATIHQQNLGLLPVHDLQAVVGARTIAPRSDATIQLEPVRCAWFKGRAIRVVSYVDGMPSVEQRVTIGRCEVSNAPMFQWSGDGWSYASRDGTTSLGLPSDVFAAPPGHAVGIEIAAFSDLANRSRLEFSVRNDNPHAVRVCIEIYGEILGSNPHNRNVEDQHEG